MNPPHLGYVRFFLAELVPRKRGTLSTPIIVHQSSTPTLSDVYGCGAVVRETTSHELRDYSLNIERRSEMQYSFWISTPAIPSGRESLLRYTKWS